VALHAPSKSSPMTSKPIMSFDLKLTTNARQPLKLKTTEEFWSLVSGRRLTGFRSSHVSSHHAYKAGETNLTPFMCAVRRDMRRGSLIFPTKSLSLMLG
jgi:hypothetical protein